MLPRRAENGVAYAANAILHVEHDFYTGALRPAGDWKTFKMTENEERLLGALAWMVEQYLSTDDEALDNESMSAGETAVELLAEQGFVELTAGDRIGRWTPRGTAFLNSH